MTENIVEQCRAQLRSDSVAEQLKALEMLAALDTAEAQDEIVGALRHADEWIVTRAAELCGNNLVTAAVSELIRVMHAAELAELARLGAARESGETNQTHISLALVQYSSDIEFMQQTAAAALEKIATSEALAAVREWRRNSEL